MGQEGPYRTNAMILWGYIVLLYHIDTLVRGHYVSYRPSTGPYIGSSQCNDFNTGETGSNLPMSEIRCAAQFIIC